jgi:hypothetical protein
MTGLLPDSLRIAVEAAGTDTASTSFTVAAFIVVVVLLLEYDIVAICRPSRSHASTLTALAIPLGVAVTATLVTRIALLAD